MTDKKLLCLVVVLFLNIQFRNSRKFRRNFKLRRQRPNIIFIMADDLDTVLGSPQVMKKTKRLLQDEGVTFQNAFASSPLCCPSRSSILTGRYAHNHQVNSNNKNCYGDVWVNGAEKENFGKLMKNAGYKTAYFGKYLNNYDGVNIPPGWDYWSGLLRNSKFYNYTVNVNGKLKKHRANYKNDYFTNVMTDASINYFTRMKRKSSSPPVMMVLSMSAPHGPEDGAPQYQNMFENVTAPRFPNFNITSADKHWIIRRTPHLEDLHVKFIDMLYRKRLQTLLSVDDAIEKVHKMLVKTKQLDNTYVVFSSDHGYHLGQFSQIKGKAQPYEADIRIPLYIRGPKIPKGVTVSEMALNIDFAPTFLDIADTRVPKFIDGTSLMDIAVGSVVNKRKGNILKPIWKDTVLITRGKIQHLNSTDEDSVMERVIPDSGKEVSQLCISEGVPSPCLEECSCPVDKKRSSINVEVSANLKNHRIKHLLVQLEKQFERLKRRIRRHGFKYVISTTEKQNKKSYAEDVIPESKKKEISTMKTKKIGILVNRKIKKSQERLQYWENERTKLAINRVLTKKVAQALATRVKNMRRHFETKTFRRSESQKPCKCNNTTAYDTSKYTIQKKVKKRKKGAGVFGIKCFHMDKDHWKSPPLWTDKSFTGCINSRNNSFWCARTINKTHNFLYCEFVTGFKEYYDINKDPYQINNIAHTLQPGVLKQLGQIVAHLKVCKGTRGCFVRAGETLSDRKDVLRKIRRFERKKRHGIYIRGETG